MNIVDAWYTLEFSYRDVYNRIASKPRTERAAQAVKELEEAKQQCKRLMAMYHPDKKDGNEHKFKLIQSAFKAIEEETINFCERIKNSISEDESKKLLKNKNSIKIEIK